jgi:hypothetical protein
VDYFSGSGEALQSLDLSGSYTDRQFYWGCGNSDVAAESNNSLH